MHQESHLAFLLDSYSPVRPVNSQRNASKEFRDSFHRNLGYVLQRVLFLRTDYEYRHVLQGLQAFLERLRRMFLSQSPKGFRYLSRDAEL